MTSPRFVIEYLNGNLRRYGNGHSLPVKAASQEEAVVRVKHPHGSEKWEGLEMENIQMSNAPSGAEGTQ